MTPERFRRVEQLVSLALQRAANERAEFIREACAGEEDLRVEVESLLASHGKEDGYLAEAPTILAAQLLAESKSLAVDPFVGRVLSHYRLDERLGAGGMGVLYRATDLKLGRAVAIKLLARHLVSDETAKARFVREARAASALDHPNIATIHEIGEEDGELFIAMALYEGETLKQRLEKGRLDVKEALEVLRQVALGLEAAHRAGIVHRDIKPANVLITSTGTVKILDFGVAKLVSDSQAQTMTQAGQAMGTMLYMSPEQLRGELVDARNDLWSLGVLAYEVLAGVSPFETDSSAATVARILHEEPPSLAAVPGVPDWLAQLVSQLLRKNPAERPQTASEVLRRLGAGETARSLTVERAPGAERSGSLVGTFTSRGIRLALLLVGIGVLAAAPGLGWYFFLRSDTRNVARRDSEPARASEPKSVAVLPFVNMSGDKENEYFSDGMTEELINALANVEGLRVASRTSAFAFKGKDIDIRQIGEKLNVGTVLEGSVRREGNTMRVTAQLIQVSDGYHLWSKSYDRELKSVFALEEDIARSEERRVGKECR